MDTIIQINNKLMAEHNPQPAPIHQATENAPPPPYTDSDSDSDSDSDDEEPMKLIINANHSIHGSNNLVPTSPSALADATKFSAILLNAINQLNNAATTAPNAPHVPSPTPRRLRVDLTINCGIAVVGNRNVIGNIGLKPKAATLTQNGFVPADGQPTAPEPEGVVAGAKRKAEEDEDTDIDAPQAKRLHGDGDHSVGNDQLQTPP
ncbi:hypothetical protein Q7P37_001364 [Cladosporium fusiforme]